MRRKREWCGAKLPVITALWAVVHYERRIGSWTSAIRWRLTTTYFNPLLQRYFGVVALPTP
jgi:hypothetical protein